MNKFVRILAIIVGLASMQEAKSESSSRTFRSSHIPQLVRQLAPVGQPAPSERITLSLSLPLQNTNELEQLLQDLYTPGSPHYRHYLGADEFAKRFGPSQSDYSRLIAFCQSNGFAIKATHPNRTILSVQGTARDIQTAFHTQLRLYEHPAEKRLFYAPEIEPSYDAPVEIVHIHGLDNLHRPQSHRRAVPMVDSNQATPQRGSGPGGMYLGTDFRKAYAPGTSLTGTGQTLALVEFDDFYGADISRYLSRAGLSSVQVDRVKIDGFNSGPGPDNGEVALDIQVAIAMAPGLQRILVYEEDQVSSPNDLLNRIATDNVAKQISCSWSWDTADPGQSQIFQQYAAQGQSFLTASGDSDAYSGAIAPPADNPYVTSVGGTRLTMGSGWSSETTWNDRTTSSGTGGGISTTFAIPNWQSAVSMTGNGGSTRFRNIPDISMVADNVMSISDNGTVYNVSGTSIAAPLWAAFVALANQQAAANGQPSVGFLNPTLYAMGNSVDTSLFHDITTGNNTSSSSPNHFFAVPGYDLCTGWGTPSGESTINALLQGPSSQAVLDHFAWSINTASPMINTPIPATITAKTQGNSTASTYSGQLTLSARSQGSGDAVVIQPATVTCNNGVWTGSIRVTSSDLGIVFTATDTQGHNGASPPIAVAAQLTGLSKPNNGGSVSGSGNWVAGTSQTLTAVPASGWKFVQWQDGDNDNPRSLTMPISNVMFTATFALIDRIPPSITISTKGGTVRGTNTDFAVNGRAFDQNGIELVSYRVNSNDWANAIGTTNWNATVTLVPGINTIEAASTDTSSNRSSIARITLNFIPTTQVSVSTISSGSVSPNINGKTMDIGKTITLTAVPAAGQIFDSWNNGITSKTARFTVTSNLSITASFVPNPFISQAGVYNGLWTSAAPITAADSGYISVTVSRTGSYSGRLVNGGTISFTGQFHADGTAQQTISVSKNPWNLSLILATNRIGGTISNANWTAEVQADRSPWNAQSNPSPFAGIYKLSAEGTNFGTLTVSTSGSAKLVAALPDKSHVSQATTISVNGDWPLYQSLYHASGSLIGWGQLANSAVTDGATWVKPSGTTALTISGSK